MERIFSIPYIKYSIITAATLLLALIISKILRILISRFIRLSSNKLKIDPTQFNFLKNAVTFIVFLGAIIFIFYTIPKLKALSLTLFAGAGVPAAVVHPNFIDHRSEEEKKEGVHPVTTRVMGYGDSSVNLRAFVWTEDHSKGYLLKTDLYKIIQEQFDKNGIEIPFPYRTIVYKKDM